MKDSKIKTINVHELKKRLDENPVLLLIDVREHEEWDELRIPQAMHIPKGQIPLQAPQKISQKNVPVYLHCRGGVRSYHAANALIDLGYEEVYSIDGGIMEWEISGYPVERG